MKQNRFIKIINPMRPWLSHTLKQRASLLCKYSLEFNNTSQWGFCVNMNPSSTSPRVPLVHLQLSCLDRFQHGLNDLVKAQCGGNQSVILSRGRCAFSRDIPATGDIYSMLYMHNKNLSDWLFFLGPSQRRL